jgi:hypothetical protein
MDHVKQAFSISDQEKIKAKKIYADAVKQLVNKSYVSASADAFVDLSALFGVKWLFDRWMQEGVWGGLELYAEANTAFNYANLTIGQEKKFVALAQSLVPKEDRVSNRQLSDIAVQMNSLLTCTTAESMQEQML